MFWSASCLRGVRDEENLWVECLTTAEEGVFEKNSACKKHAKSQWALSNIFVCQKSQPTCIIREFSKFKEKVFSNESEIVDFYVRRKEAAIKAK